MEKWLALSYLLHALSFYAEAAWNQSQPLWTQLTLASDLKHLDCEYLGSYELLIDDAFPDACFSKAVIIGADSFDARPDASKCYFKKCGTIGDIRFADNFTIGSSYTILTNSFKKMTRAADHHHLDCDYLGSYVLASGDSFPMSCSSKAIILGGDSFDVKPDLSKCYFKKCGSFDDIKFGNQFTTGASYSLLAKEWIQVTVDSNGFDCDHLGSYTLSASDSFPDACYSTAIISGGDSFDAKPDGSQCYFKKCGALADMKFANQLPTGNSFTLLTEGFKQITRAEDDTHLDCDYLGSYEMASGDTFPMACFSRAIVLRADSFDAKPDQSKCYFKKCGTLTDMKFANKLTTGSSYTLLTGGWVQITRADDNKHTDCDYLSSYELSASDPFPETCYSKAILVGGDTFDAKPDSSKCYFKKCGTWEGIKFSDKFTTGRSYTILFPRGGEGDWPPCDPETCIVDLNLYWTAELRGKQLPCDTSLNLCDPATYVNGDGAPCYGSNARRLTYLNQEKARLAAKNETAIVFDLGGSAFGSPMFSLPGYPVGAIPTSMMNDIPYDFCAFAQTDFLFEASATNGSLQRQKEYVQSLEERACRWIMSNARFSGLFSPLNSKLDKFRVVQAGSGKKIGFVYMFPHDYNVGYRFDNALELDWNSPISYFVSEHTSELARLVLAFARTNVTAFRHTLGVLFHRWDSLEDAWHDLYRIGSLINVDILDTSVQMRQAHPDIAAMVLLVGKTDQRMDQIHWMLEHGPFDVILETEYSEKSLTYHSQTYGKTRLLLSSKTLLGIGKLRARIDQTGVGLFDFQSDFPLSSEIDANPDAVANASKFYESIRAMNKKAYGIISSPVVGVHRLSEPSVSLGMCYYMDCPHGDVIGAALLWQARKLGYKVDFALSNLGGVRAALVGNASTGAVSMSHCERTLGFKNMVYVWQASGKTIYEGLATEIQRQDRGFIGGGVRAAFYEPCWDYVNHRSFENIDWSPPGSPAELEACRNAKGWANSEIQITVTDIQFEMLDYSRCDDIDDYTTCTSIGWERLTKGSTYTFATTAYFAERAFPEAKMLPGQLIVEPQALCNYIGAHSPLQVDSWQEYADRGGVQFALAEEGWAAGNRVPSVKNSQILIVEANCQEGQFLVNGICAPCPMGTESTTDAERDRCVPCLTGRYSDERGLGRCKNCPGGMYQNAMGQSTCVNCTSGFYSEVGWPVCSKCASGTVAEEGDAMCSPCPVGRFAEIVGRNECLLCIAGRAATDIGTSECVACSLGRFASESGMSACELCRIGKFADSPATTACISCASIVIGSATATSGASDVQECETCAAGSFTSGLDRCSLCPDGYFAQQSGQTSCKSCSKGMATWQQGATQCVYTARYLLSAFAFWILLFLSLTISGLTVQRSIMIDDIGMEMGNLVITTVNNHRITSRMGNVSIILRDARHPSLIGRFKVRVISYRRLLLLEANGQPMGRCDSSCGYIRLPFPSDMRSTIMWVPAWLLVLLLLAAAVVCMIVSVLTLEHVALALGVAMTAAGVAIGVIRVAIPYVGMNSPLQKQIKRFKKIIRENQEEDAELQRKLTMTSEDSDKFTKEKNTVTIGSSDMIRINSGFSGNLTWGSEDSEITMDSRLSRLSVYTDTTSTNPGATRAISFGQLKDFHDFFASRIRDRNMYYVVANIIEEMTKESRLSFAEFAGPSPVDWFVSHYWGDPFEHLVRSVECHAKDDNYWHVSDAPLRSRSYWICSFSNNQWNLSEELGSHWSHASFFLALNGATCRGTLMILDESVHPLSRSWCLFELTQTFEMKSKKKRKSYFGLVIGTGAGVINSGKAQIATAMILAQRLATIDLADASASNQADKKMIDDYIAEETDGLSCMNNFIKSETRGALLACKESFESDFNSLLDKLPSQSATLWL